MNSHYIQVLYDDNEERLRARSMSHDCWVTVGDIEYVENAIFKMSGLRYDKTTDNWFGIPPYEEILFCNPIPFSSVNLFTEVVEEVEEDTDDDIDRYYLFPLYPDVYYFDDNRPVESMMLSLEEMDEMR